MTTRNYSSRSQQTTLTSAATAGASTIVVQSGTALLGGQSIPAGTTFTIVIDPDTAIEEIVDATAVSTNTFTITRAIDGSSAQAHSAGAVVRHMAIGRDYREANAHIEASTGVHGISNASSVVGTTDTQTLTNKTLTSPTITNPSISGAGVDASIVFEGATADAYETTLTVVDPTQDNTITMPNTTGTVVIATAVQTLTNKTLTSPTISGSPVITGLSSAGMVASSATPKDYVDSILGSATAAATSAASAATSATSAATSATSAASSASAAAGSATASANSATAAATSATSAAASATAAATSATSSAASATTAQAWAIQLVTPVSGSDYSAKYNANLAAASASSASTSASSAATSASSAATSATNAANSATASASSASAAATSATSAAASATAAATSATSAAASATAAATSATSAAASATAAAGYVVPSQTGNAGKFLGTNGTAVSWTNSTTGSFGVGEGIGSTSAVLQIGNGRTADGNAYIDLVGDTTYTDYGLRIIRASGANGVSQIIHRGTNNFALTATDAGNILLQTNATTRMVIDSAGNVGIGGAPAAGQIFAITKDLTGSTSPIGASVSGTIQSDATVGTRGFNTFISTAATAFTVPTIYHYRAAQGTFGAGSTVTNQFGFYAETTLTDAGTNVGFYGNIAASSGRFNFYAGGTAANYFAGRTGIGATLTSGAMAQVVNTTAADVGFIIKGAASQTGDLLQVQNSAASVLARFDANGNLGIGTAPSTTLHVSSGSGARVRAGGATGSGFEFNDASTRFDIPAANTIAAYTSNAERMRIDSAGNVGIGTTPTARLHASTSSTTAYGLISQTPVVGLTAGNTVNMAYFADGRSTANDGLRIYNLRDTTAAGTGNWETSTFRIQRNVDGAGAQSEIIFGASTLSFAAQSGVAMSISGSNTTINAIADATTTTAARGGGYMGIPASAAAGSGAYTVVAGDAGEHIYTTTTRTVTIPANASVAFPVGTVLSFISGVGATTTIAITSDTMYLAGAGTTGSRTLAAHGMATAVKVASTTWYISGNGLT